ncbi:MAG: ERF family protein [Verrucomicrobiae bacterium]|nr:ERF family protein [Verrucomicrobiae bacterium]
MTEQALVRAEPEVTTIIQVIERAASNPSVDLDKMERLLEMQERILNRNAEAEFNEAMTRAQSEMGRISADANNPQTRSRYASYGQLDRHLRPIYAKHGFSLSFSTEPAAVPEAIRVTCTVAKGGFSRQYHIDMPADGKGAKGGDVMTKTHATGAAVSYGMRYLLKMIFNVAVGEDDDDGNIAPQSPGISETQAADLAALIEDVGADRDKFLRYMRVTTLEQIPASAYANAVKALEAKRAKS